MIKDVIPASDKNSEIDPELKVENWMLPNPTYIKGSTSVKNAAKMLQWTNVDCLAVVNDELSPIGMVTPHSLIPSFVNGNNDEPVINRSMVQSMRIRFNQSIFEVLSEDVLNFSVIDEDNRLVGMLSKKEILKGLSKYAKSVSYNENTSEAMNVILESAYEGIAVVDENGIILEFNQAYSRFTGINRKDAVGKHVCDVIDNTNLHHTVQTGMPERGVIQYIQGQAMIVHRIPIWKNDRVVGAIGMLIFEGVTEVYRIYEKLQGNPVGDNRDVTSTLNLTSNSVTMDQIIGTSKNTSKTKRLARKVAKTNATVLITGQSGSGKELYAKGIHNLSPRSSGPFISVNCGAIPEHLFESELFGYEKGAFTGANRDGKPGKFELAQNGTLFLDEIGEMPLMMQTKLLRILQEKEVERVGGIQKYEVNARVIAATNRDLKEMIEKGKFREDLYYRINVIELPISPLRDRIEDIPALVSFYIQEVCSKHQVPKKKLTSEVMSVFLQYRWPGNIRELVNTLERLVVLVDGDIIELTDVPSYILNKRNGNVRENQVQEQRTSIKQVQHMGNEKEKELILNVLKEVNGNKTKAANKLGIHRTTLYQKLKKFQVDY